MQQDSPHQVTDVKLDASILFYSARWLL